jgi:hypothetical protein
MRLEVFMTVMMKIAGFWDVTPCSLPTSCQERTASNLETEDRGQYIPIKRR